MKITTRDMELAVQEGIISREQADRLMAFLRGLPSSSPRFNLTNILYYLGGLLAIGAMTLFMNLGWEAFGGWGIFAISCGYGIGGLALTRFFRNRELHVPAGICAVFVVALTPLAVYGLQKGMGWWPDTTSYRDYHRIIRYHWYYMEMATLAMGAFMAWRYRYPFLLMPIAATLWYLSMDLTDLITGGISRQSAALVSLWFGIGHILLALWVDIRSRRSADYAFWLYLFGVLTFWGGMTALKPSGEWSRFCYMLVNLGLIGTGVMLVRRVFVVFGGIGLCLYLGHLAFTLFKDSWFFPISLTLIGLAVVALGVWWQRYEQVLGERLRALLPDPLRELLEMRR